jgi:methionyl-tRNA formyltransferase
MKLHYFTSGARERILRAVLNAGHEVVAVYVTDPQLRPQVKATVEECRARGIRVNPVTRGDLAGLAERLRGEICLCAGFAYLFPKTFLASVAACLNVHGTLLPKYAGWRTLNWVIERGEAVSGVTVHVVDEGVDTGPIVFQRSFPLSRFETGRSLARKTAEFEPQVVLEALALFEEQGIAGVRPQPAAGVERYPDRIPEHSRLDAGRPLIDLYDQIRAADPDRYPAYFEIDGQRVCVRLWRPDKPAEEFDLI